MKKSILFLSLIFFAGFAFAQTQIDSIVNKECNRYMSGKGAVGLSVGVWVDGKPFTYNYGAARVPGSEAPDANSIYSIGSVSKTFIAMLLARAVIEKRLTLQDDIRKYLPDTINFGRLQYEQNPVRLIHLANHTSRIPSQLARLPADWNRFSPQQKYTFKKAYTKVMFLQDLKAINLDTIPGCKYEYSNAGFKVLSIILENVYQMSFEQLINKYVSDDLKMNDTKVFLTKEEWQQRFASGNQDVATLMSTKDIDDFTSGPVVYSTVSDMLKYISYNLSENNKAIRLTHKTTYANNEKIEIGLAWRTEHTATGEKYFFHSGSGTGCNSVCLFMPARKTGVIILANETSDQKKIIDLGTDLLTELSAHTK